MHPLVDRTSRRSAHYFEISLLFLDAPAVHGYHPACAVDGQHVRCRHAGLRGCVPSNSGDIRFSDQ